nr:uncharacterized protein LOC117990969 [Maniola hyperantus]
MEEKNECVCKVSVKVPPFWLSKPAMWFAHIETQFRVRGITADQTKYDHVVSNLDLKVMLEVEDIITSPPQENKYEHLKAELIRRLSVSEGQRVRQLLTEEELGDRKPSQFLRHLRSLAGNTLTDEGILRQLFMRRLPLHLQTILAASADPLDDIAMRADKILEVAPNITATPTQASVYAAAASGESNDPLGLHAFAAQMKELTVNIAALTNNSRSGRNRSRSSSNRRSRSQSGSDEYCWYHRKFQHNATKCTSPCSWKQENGNDRQ